MGRVIVLGSINVDLEVRVAGYPAPGEKAVGESLSRFAGGKGANQAIAARRQGAEVIMVGAVGDDDAGRASLNRLYAHGIKLYVDRIPGAPTGHALVMTDSRTNAIIVIPGANERVASRALDPIKNLTSADLLLTQFETPVDKVVGAIRFAAGYGVRIMINLAPYAELPDDVVALADPLVIPEGDLAAFEARGVRPKSLVVLRGKAGITWDGVEFASLIVPDAQVVDTVGATDALIGTLAAAITAGRDHATAARLGLQAAVDNVQHLGAQQDPRL